MNSPRMRFVRWLGCLALVLVSAAAVGQWVRSRQDDDVDAADVIRIENRDRSTLQRLAALGYLPTDDSTGGLPSKREALPLSGDLTRLVDIVPTSVSVAGEPCLTLPGPDARTVIDLDDWQPDESIQGVRRSRGGLAFGYQGERPFITSPELELSAAGFRELHLTMKTDSGRFASLFWITRSSPVPGVDRSVTFEIRSDGKPHQYVLDLTDSPYWNGVVTGLRLYPNETDPALWPEHRDQLSFDCHRRAMGTPDRQELLAKLGFSPGSAPPVTGQVEISKMEFLAGTRSYVRRKVEIDSTSMDSLYLATPGSMAFAVTIPQEQRLVLEYSVGSVGLSEDTEVTVLAREADTEHALDTIRLPAITYGQWWVKRRLDLSSLRGKEVQLEFRSSSESNGGTPVFLGNPILYCPDRRSSPNVIVVAYDALRADRLSCYGCAEKTTPNIDEFAAGGILFENNYAQGNWTRVSFRSMFRSLYESNPNGKEGLPLFRAFRGEGYYVQGFHCNPNLDWRYDFMDGFDCYSDYAMDAFGQHLVTYSANVGTNLAINWLASNDKRPFFLLLYILDPHAPFRPTSSGVVQGLATSSGCISDAWDNHHRGISFAGAQHATFLQRADQLISKEEFERIGRLYNEEVKAIDREFGRLMGALRELSLLEDTIVVLTADHGEELGDHGNLSHSHTYYEELIKVPLIISFPTRFKTARRVAALTESLDIAPTVAELAGLQLEIGQIDGQSLLPLMEGRAGYSKTIAVCGPATVAGRFKLINEDCLFDLVNDPYERNNVAGIFPAEVERITRAREKRIKEKQCGLFSRIRGLVTR